MPAPAVLWYAVLMLPVIQVQTTGSGSGLLLWLSQQGARLWFCCGDDTNQSLNQSPDCFIWCAIHKGQLLLSHTHCCVVRQLPVVNPRPKAPGLDSWPHCITSCPTFLRCSLFFAPGEIVDLNELPEEFNLTFPTNTTAGTIINLIRK